MVNVGLKNSVHERVLAFPPSQLIVAIVSVGKLMDVSFRDVADYVEMLPPELDRQRWSGNSAASVAQW
jgi:hypothetical protein